MGCPFRAGLSPLSCFYLSVLRYHGDVKNFKINRDAGGQYSVSSKKFNSLDELLYAYSKNPFRSKKGGTEIYLLYPIPVDKTLEQRHMMMHNEGVNSKLCSRLVSLGMGWGRGKACKHSS